ncbi:MAG TPA: hypothetical protein VMI35_13170 [Puia sp.]|nr:hypothetical protein [Puia sp.]
MKKISVVLLIYLVCTGTCLAHVTGGDPATFFYEGYLVLKNSHDTLRGAIQMGSPKYGKDFIVYRLDTSTRAIEKTEIDVIRLYYKSGPDSVRKFTDFKSINFQKNIIWRLLASGKADVYDNELYPDTERYYLGKSLGELSDANVYDLVVVSHEGAERERIPASSVNLGTPQKKNHFIVKYINKRYKTNLSAGDFDSNAAMIRYIAEHG